MSENITAQSGARRATAQPEMSKNCSLASSNGSSRSPLARLSPPLHVNQKSAKAEKTVLRYRFVLEEFKKRLGTKAQKPLAAVTPRDVQAFLDKRLQDGSSPKTVSVDRKTLSSCFGNAFKHGVILHNPVLATEIPRVVSCERDVFTAAQVGLLVATLDKPAEIQKLKLVGQEASDWKTAIVLGYYTGARLGDCVGMTWDSVDLTDGVIRYRQEKTDAGLKFSCTPASRRT